LPVLLIFVLGIMDAGRLLWIYSTLYRAVEAAARCAAVNATACGTSTQIQNDAVQEAWGLKMSPASFSVSNPSCGVQVSSTYTFTFYTPGFGSVPLAMSACVPMLY
jgi:Flp pilus assembly protein TadG